MKNMLKIVVVCGLLVMSVGQIFCVNHFIKTAQSMALQRARIAEHLHIRRARETRVERREVRALMREIRIVEVQTNALMRGLTEEQSAHTVAVTRQRLAERDQVLERRLERRELRAERMQRLLLQLPEEVRARVELIAQQTMEAQQIVEVQQTMEIQGRALEQ